jgi:ABC-type nickel/cobalt efflux system permease component RcnA
MFGVDQSLANLSDGTTILVVVAVAVLLGLRHASDPDHLAAVTTLIASGREHAGLAAARLGFAWGLGHATSLFVFGVPIVLYDSYLPRPLQQAAETTVGVVIVGLAAWLLLRWHRGQFRDVSHAHAHTPHAHVHHRRRPHGHRTRGPVQAYGIGLVHGLGGSAGVGLLLLATIRGHLLAIAALGLFALFTAISMALLSVGFGLTLSRPVVQRSFNRLAPALGLLSLAFGLWYVLGAQDLVPYVF